MRIPVYFSRPFFYFILYLLAFHLFFLSFFLSFLSLNITYFPCESYGILNTASSLEFIYCKYIQNFVQ